MIISFTNIPFVLFCVCAAFAIALHVASTFFKGKAAMAATYVNVVLHLGIFVLLFFAGAGLDLAVATFMASVAIYLALSYAFYLVSKREAEK